MAPECQISTDEQDPTEFVCRWLGCGENFGCLDELVSHLTSIHVTSQHGVFYCSWKGCIRAKGFNARYKMLIHIRTHTNERPFACPDCSKRFSRQENLRIHSRTHTGEKPYVCTVAGCSKAYSNSSDRFKHTRTHFVEKPYECRQPGCGKKYTDPSSLRKHVKIYGHARRPEELDSKKETFAMDQSDINFIAKGKSNMQRNTNDTCINLMDTYSYDNGSTLSSNRDTKNDVNIEQMLTAVAAAVRLSPTPSTPTDLRISSSSSDPQVEFAQNLLKLASSRLSHTHNDWNTVSPVDSAEINAAAAWNVALQQYRAGLLFGADPKCMEHLGSSFIESTITQPHLNENQAQYKSFKPTINHPHTMEMSRSPSPLDLSLPSSKNRQDQ